ncbi:FAD linked oxidase-like protein, partial [Rhizoctonia solani]
MAASLFTPLVFVLPLQNSSLDWTDESILLIDMGTIFGPIIDHWDTWRVACLSSTARSNPACIFVPESSSDVSVAIKIFVDNNCQFAVRGGGHTTNPGWASTDSGVLVSLSKLTAIEISDDTKSVVIGAVAGGRASTVGVSGFLLGGGLSFLLHSEGFSANTVLSYEIVLASGEVATVTSKSNKDLFRALKGGQGILA